MGPRGRWMSSVSSSPLSDPGRPCLSDLHSLVPPFDCFSHGVPSPGTFAQYQSLCPLYLDPYQAPGSNTRLSRPSRQGRHQVELLWGHRRFARRF